MSLSLLWEVTLGSWLTAALILTVRLILGRWLSPRAKYLLWLILVLRLLPIPLGSPLSLLSLTPEPVRAEAVAEYLAPAETGAEAAGSAAAAAAGPLRAAGATLSERLVTFWLMGIGAVLLVYIVLYAIALGRIRRLPPCLDLETEREYLNLKQLVHPGFCPRLALGSQGMLGGFFRPILVIPAERRGRGAVPILLHELMHYRSGDLWLGLLFRLLCAMYWFNPAVWACFWLARRDGERACDQRVLETKLVTPKDYAETLLEEYRLRGKPEPAPLARFGDRGLKRRIRGILEYRRRSPASRVLTGFAAVLILALCLSPLSGRSYGFDRSILAQTGYADADSYLAALNDTSLGGFGLTWAALTEAGFLDPGEGTWTNWPGGKRVLTVSRLIAGETLRVQYVFCPTLYTADRGIAVLTEIRADYPPRNENADWKVRLLGQSLLEGWPELEERYVLYTGGYRPPVRPGLLEGWEFLLWQDPLADPEAWDWDSTVYSGRVSYEIRCTPVTLGDCLSLEEKTDLAARMAEAGWTADRYEAMELLEAWHLAALVGTNAPGRWTLNGMAAALCRTRPNARP